VSVIDRRRAPVVQKEPSAQLPARSEREAIMSRARDLVSGKSPAPAPALPATLLRERRGPVATKQAAPPRADRDRRPARANVPVAGSRAATARARPTVPALRAAGQNEVQVAPPAGARPGETVQNGAPGSNQTIIVQVAAPAPVYPWYGPFWWGYHPAACSSRSCPLRSGRPCTRWLCW
jgi:hypothetical protein